MARKRSKKKTDFNQYLPWIIVGALVLVFLVMGADPTGKFTEVTKYSFVTETGEMYDAQAIPAVGLAQEGSPGERMPEARESQDIYVLSNNVKIIKLDNVPSELDAGTLISALYIEHSENAVAVDLSELSRYKLTFTMYLPNLGSGVFICPEAKTLSQVTDKCQDIQNLEHDQLTSEDGQYIIEELIGTGGQGNPPPQTVYQDSDSDGYGNPSVSQSCTSNCPPLGYVLDSTDCDDTDGAVWQTVASYTDSDGDGYGTGSTPQQVCTSSPVQDNTDCDDTDVNAYEEYCLDWDDDGYCTVDNNWIYQSGDDPFFQISCGPSSYNSDRWITIDNAEYDSNGDLYPDCNPRSESMGNTQNDGWLPKQYNVSPYFPNNIDWSGVAQTACGNYDSVGYGMSSNYSQGLNCPCWWYGSPP